MADDTENHTLKLLQEMRKEINERFDGIDKRFDDVDARLDGLTHMTTLLAGYQYQIDSRVETLENVKE